MDYVFTPPAPVSAPVPGDGAQFPVRRIFCVGQNYADHVKEMGSNPSTEAPVFFTKPADALVGDGAKIPFPPGTDNLHHEAEFVVALASGGLNIPAEDALSHVYGYATGNDLTRRDLQGVAKAAGRPWDMAKGFDNSAVLGPIQPVSAGGHPTTGAIRCDVDGELRQNGDLSQMIWSVPDIIAHLSRLVELAAGDLIYTGTPAGVGAIKPGQTVTVTIDGLPSVSVTIG